MAENEKNTAEVVETASAEKEVKAAKKSDAKPKKDKPSIGSRIVGWFRTTKAELKKIVWTPKKLLIRNTVLTVVVIAITGAVIGLLDAVFSISIAALGQIF